MRLYHDIFIKHDATLIEINPMSESNDGTGSVTFSDLGIFILIFYFGKSVKTSKLN